MTRLVERSQIVDYATYAEQRNAERERIFAVKTPRRIHVGDVLTFLFENNDTMRYQVQEMMLAERIVKETAIQHEIDTYNGLLGGPGELGCSLLIEIDDPQQRAEKLHRWLPLPKHLYVRLEDGSQVRATYDSSQIGEDRLSAVQYIKFDTKGHVPLAVGCDFPELSGETKLNDAQRRALQEDLQD
jgi:hypothetical protein